MSWEAIGAIGEALGAVGVILTLAYLAVQIRQNTRSQQTESYGRALDRVTTLQGRLSENAELADILLRGAVDHESLSANERVRFAWMFYEMFSAFEFIYHQSQSDAMPRDVWQRWADTLCWWMSYPGVRAWWSARPAPFTPDFSEFVDQQAAERPTDTAAQNRWTRYLYRGAGARD
ncbi:MAG: hypothetical protein PVH91_06455 [Pseudomonadales bacterium]|jgi:hypothetical protein